MAVVSVSLPQELVEEMDALVEREGYRGRSDAMRTALRHLLQARQPVRPGHLHGTITLLYPEGNDARISEVRHAFHDVILSLMHTHCEPEVCMDVLIVGGPAERLRELHRALERLRFMDRAVLVPFDRQAAAQATP